MTLVWSSAASSGLLYLRILAKKLSCFICADKIAALNTFYEKQPALLPYKRSLNDILRKKAHILSDAEEKILAAAGDLAQSPEDIFGLLNDAPQEYAPLRFPVFS